MVYKICAVILTIVMSTIGIYVIRLLKSIQKITEETGHTLALVNQDLPEILQELKTSANSLKNSAQTLQDRVIQVTSGVERISQSPTVVAATNVVNTLRTGMNFLQRMRGKGA